MGAGPPAAELAVRLRDRPGLVCLTGQWAGGDALVTADPIAVVTDEQAFAALDAVPEVTGSDIDAIGGGWFGVLGYDGRHHVSFHDWVLRRVDGVWWFESLHSATRAAALAAARDRAALALRTPSDASGDGPYVDIGTFTGPSRDEHLAAVERAIEAIRAGDIYQVNICTRLCAPFTGSALELFRRAVSQLHPDYAAFAALDERHLVSLSPELFVRRRGRAVVTAPIKGTRPRVGGDEAGADELRRSAKDAAENVMIVDLMRNDLGRVCATGSVEVDALLRVEPHPGVWHLVSRVRGQLRPEVGDAQLLRAVFPPGSVTGAPKLRAMEVLAGVERQPRGAYTGAIGFVSPCWGAEFNVAIRTFEVAAGEVQLGVGGGITADSVPMLEWQECLHKAAPLVAAAGGELPGVVAAARHGEMAHPGVYAAGATRRAGRDRGGRMPMPSVQGAGGVLETVLVLAGHPLRLADHLARLERSCRELYGTALPPDTAARALAAASAQQTAERAVLRVVATPDGALAISCGAASPRPDASAACVLPRGPLGVWRHKWADRSQLAAAERAAGTAIPLFVADDGTVLETSRGNVFLLRADGTLVTPPLRDDLLPGVTRRALLDAAHDAGRPVELHGFGVDEMVSGTPFWTSSLSLAIPIIAVDGRAVVRDDAAVASFAAWLTGGEANVR